MAKSDDPSRHKTATRLVRLGRDKDLTGPFVNPPVVHASTVLFETVDDMVHRRQRFVYGRTGTPTIEALESAMTALEGAAGTVLCPSGLAAIGCALLSCLKTGDRLLMADCVYAPARRFADSVLKRMGIETVYFDPAIGAGIETLFGERTRAVYLESPGSLTFEMQDVPAIAATARARDAAVVFDNTWATPLFFKPLANGADFSVQAVTKYIGGHSDIMLGTVAASQRFWPRLKETHTNLGLCVGPEVIYLGLRGLRTLAVRLERQMASALKIAAWLTERAEVARVLYPALPDDPGHAIWKRDMSGANSLFGVVLDGWSDGDAARFIEGLELFGIGASWGGFESLAVLANPRPIRSVTSWQAAGPLIRLHIGLEDPDDLIADLDQAFTAARPG
jgi:cystathionine beta-lyase